MNVFKNMLLTGAEGRPVSVDLFYQGTHGRPVIIYAHGFNGFKDWGNFDLIATQFANAGFVFIKFNFSHNGTTPGEPEAFVDLEAYGNNNYTKELHDLDVVMNWIVAENNPHAVFIDSSKLFLIGHSRGGGITVLKASEDTRVKAIAAWASVAECKTPWGSWPSEKMEQWKTTGVQYIINSRTKQELPVYYQLYQDYLDNEARLNIIDAAKRLGVPFLICHGTKDESVPVSKAYALHKANTASELFLVDSDHVFGRKHPWTEADLPGPMQEVVNKTIGFFIKAG